MVSGFLTSPCDHSRIFSGDASEIRIAEKDSGSFGFSKKLKMSFIAFLVGYSSRIKKRKTELFLNRGAFSGRSRCRRRRRRGGGRDRAGAGLRCNFAGHQLQRGLLLAR